jgi:hypothetical protein
MSLLRAVSVGFQGPNRKIEEVTATIPAEWVTGDRDALTEIYENNKLRTRIAVTPGAALWAKISDPYNPVSSVRVVRG